MRRLRGSSPDCTTAPVSTRAVDAARNWAVAFAVVFVLASTASAAVDPLYWRQRVFFIPYQPAASASRGPTDTVDFLVARDGASEWAVLQQAQSHVRGFSYHAPVDGQYAFALRTSDGSRTAPLGAVQPQLRVVVDTQSPTLKLDAQLDAAGKLLVRYEALDAHLKAETMRLEMQVDGGPWQAAPLGPPDLSQPDRLLGQLPWKPPVSAGEVKLRATIEDRAGNQATTGAQASLVGPLLSPADGPAFSFPAAGPGRGGFDAPSAAQVAPPAQNPYASQPAGAETGRAASSRTPAQLVADGGSPFPSQSPFAVDATPADLAGEAPPLFQPPAAHAAPAAGATAWGSRPISHAPHTVNRATATPAPVLDADGVRWLNSLTFDVDYDLQAVGPWGVAKVELYVTRDDGQSWTNYGPDPDNRGPMRVTAPAAGVYGFRLVVSGANGAAVATPQPGDAPELLIGVDLEPPQAELQAAEIGQAELADHLIIRWAASDANLDARPIGLFFSGQADGPWTMIATDLENSGQYAWRLLRQVPDQLFLRLEVRDKAGNVAARQSAGPVELNLPQPTGRFRNVRPIAEDPGRYRTAAGSR